MAACLFTMTVAYVSPQTSWPDALALAHITDGKDLLSSMKYIFLYMT